MVDKVIDFEQAKKKVEVKGRIIDEISNFEDEVVSAIIILRTKNNEIVNGFFDTSFQDEAVMSKTLDFDIYGRQMIRMSRAGEE